MITYVETGMYLHKLTSALNGGGQLHAMATFPSGKETSVAIA
jgi:hypothetical protein